MNCKIKEGVILKQSGKHRIFYLLFFFIILRGFSGFFDQTSIRKDDTQRLTNHIEKKGVFFARMNLSLTFA